MNLALRRSQTVYTPANNVNAVPPATVQQKGTVAIVAGTQSYAITFPSAFGSAPTFFGANVQMVNSSGEVFTVVADLSTLTASGVTVWLSGIPTAASTGAFINWIANQ